MHEGDSFSAKTLLKKLISLLTDWSRNGPAGQFWQMDSALETRLRNISLKEVAKSRWEVTFTHIEKLKKQFIRTQTQ